MPLSALLVGVILFKFALENSLDPQRVPQNWRSCLCDDAESSLASGKLLALNRIDMYSLELIKGLSDTLAVKVLKSRGSIQRVAEYLRPGEKYRAFEVVHGIGIKTAQKLSRFIDPLPATIPGAREQMSVYTLTEGAEERDCNRSPA